MTAKTKPQFTTRRPTGRPSWPILLIAGAEKAGKSWAAAAASGSDLIGRTLWIGLGEDDPEEYGPDPVTGEGGVPGADFEIVNHEGTYRNILAAIEWANEQPDVDGKPTLLVIDSMTILWNLLVDMAQDTANQRAERKGRNVGDAGADITMDLWNSAKDRWRHVIDALRAHRGPVILTARLDEVTVMDGGKPTTDKTLKVQAEKSLPYDVGGIVKMPRRGEAWLEGVRSTRLSVPKAIPMPGFTVDDLWRKLGLADTQPGTRSHSHAERSDPIATQRTVLLGEIRNLVKGDAEAITRIGNEWSHAHDGQPITETTDIGGLELLRDEIAAQASGTRAVA